MAKKKGDGIKAGRGTSGYSAPESTIDADEVTLEERVPFFVDAYFANNCSPSKAALALGIRDKSRASRMMQLSVVRDEIARRLSEYKAGADEVLSVLSLHLRADLGLLLNEDGEFDWKLALERGVTRMIKKLKIRKRTIVGEEGGPEVTELQYELELHDSQSAAWKLANIMGLEQRPKENEGDQERKAKMYARMVERVTERAMTEGGQIITREKAIDLLAAYEPEIRQYVM